MASGYADGAVDVAISKFREFDQDRSGTIEPSEFKVILQELDAAVWTEAKIQRLMLTLDKNSDGHIQMEEFLDWALRSFEHQDFRAQLGFAKPTVTWRPFDMKVTQGSKRVVLQGVHPAHKARVLWQRVALEFGLAPSEVQLTFPSRRIISYGAIGEDDNLSDYGFATYCFPDAEIPTLYVKTKPRVDDAISELASIRDMSDENLKDMWFAPVLESCKRRASMLEEEGLECKIKLITKEKPKKAAWDRSDDAEEDSVYPLLAFFIGDYDNPKALNGKQVFSLGGEFPGYIRGLPPRFAADAKLSGALSNEDIKAALEEERGKAKVRAEEMLKEAEEADNKDLAAEATRMRKSAFTGVSLMPLSRQEREIIHDAVTPFIMRVWNKITEHKGVRDDGHYTSDIKKDGFEVCAPQELSPDPVDNLKRWGNSILGLPVETHLRLFKALQLLDVDAKE